MLNHVNHKMNVVVVGEPDVLLIEEAPVKGMVRRLVQRTFRGALAEEMRGLHCCLPLTLACGTYDFTGMGT